MPNPAQGKQSNPSGDTVEPTRLESVDDIRRAAGGSISGFSPYQPIPTVKEPQRKVDKADTVCYRPVRRPSVAWLCVLDDGKEEGEWICIRTETFLIGRTEGQLIISHDEMMSSQHAGLSRHYMQNRWHWQLKDLQSTNGTYVRIAESVLRHDQHIQLGGSRFRFDSASHVVSKTQEGVGSGVAPKLTKGWQKPSISELIPSLVECTLQGDGKRHFLSHPENWLGRDPAASNVVLPDDLMISPKHALIRRDSRGKWIIKNAGSLNGVWVRVNRLTMEGTAQFQLGEQRFILKVT